VVVEEGSQVEAGQIDRQFGDAAPNSRVLVGHGDHGEFVREQAEAGHCTEGGIPYRARRMSECGPDGRLVTGVTGNDDGAP